MDANRRVGVVPVDEAEEKREEYSDQGDPRRSRSDPEHLLQVGLQTNLEQQQHHTDLGEDVNDLVQVSRRRDYAEHACTENDARDQLSQNGWLPPALGQLAEHLRTDQNRDQNEEYVPDAGPVTLLAFRVCLVAGLRMRLGGRLRRSVFLYGPRRVRLRGRRRIWRRAQDPRSRSAGEDCQPQQEEQQLERTGTRPGPPFRRDGTGAAYHWDCAPSTIFCTRSRIASS